MARSLFATLDRVFGSPRPDAEIVAAQLEKRDLLFAERLIPGALDAEALDDCKDLRNTRVGIVGAGFAGLTAAWYLGQCGAQVVVFEASDLLGGRVQTDRDLIPGRLVEAGAELIGDNHAMWGFLAETFGLQLVDLTDESDYEGAGLEVRLRLGNLELDRNERKQLHADLLPVFDAIGNHARDIDQVRPWLSPNADVFDHMSVSDRLDELLPLTSDVRRRALEFMLGNDNCASVANQSYLGLLALVSAGRMDDSTEGMRGYWTATETCRCDGGNDQLADALATGISDLRLATPVAKIVIADDSVGIEWFAVGAGGSDAFDYVVLAAPPTSWPAVESTFGFDPAEFTMSHGPAVKYLSVVERPFWVDYGFAPSALWDELGSVWEGTDQQADEELGLALSVYAGGVHVTPEDEYPVRLSEFFPGYAPIRVRFVDWPNELFIGTGYSVPSPGQVGDIGRSLSIPFADRMMFAGEQSCVPFFGYMEGALQSGARAARDIVAAVCPEAFG